MEIVGIKCNGCGMVRKWRGYECLTFCDCLADKLEDESNLLDAQVMPKAEFTPIVAHVVIKGEVQKLLLENLCRDWNNEMYIDYEQSLLSYKAEQK